MDRPRGAGINEFTNKEITPEQLRTTNNPALMRLAKEVASRNKTPIYGGNGYYSRMHNRHNRA
jgi:hypothetical protein